MSNGTQWVAVIETEHEGNRFFGPYKTLKEAEDVLENDPIFLALLDADGVLNHYIKWITDGSEN